MNSIHRITGYAKRTERLEREHDVPSDKLGEVYALAKVSDADEGAVGSYPLDAEAARRVGVTLGTIFNVDAFDWFLEPFAEG